MKIFQLRKIRHSCLDFLPKTETVVVADIKKILPTVDFLLYAAGCLAESLEAFYLSKAYHLFNPNVGENFCQARACYISMLATEAEEKTQTIKKRIALLNKSAEKLAALRNNLMVNDIQKKFYGADQQTLKSFLAKNDCFFEISKKELFLFSCYFLTSFQHKEPFMGYVVDWFEISKTINISKRFAQDLMRYHRKLLAAHSCDFVIYCMEYLECDPEDMRLLQKMRKQDNVEREVLPCYFASKVLFAYTVKKQMPVLMLVQRLTSKGIDFVAMYFTFSKAEQRYRMSEISGESPAFRQSCVVLAGFSNRQYVTETKEEFINRFEQVGLQRIFLATMAAHPQYSGNKLVPYRMNPFSADLYQEEPHAAEWLDELMRMQVWARDYGCSQENPSLFGIEHMSCSTPEYCLNNIEQNFYIRQNTKVSATTRKRLLYVTQ